MPKIQKYNQIQQHSIITELNEYNRSLKQAVCSTLVKKSNPSSNTEPIVKRESSSSPKIVAFERKKVFKYEPIYMQKRHSLTFGEDFENIEEFNKKHQAPPTMKPMEKPRRLFTEDQRSPQPIVPKDKPKGFFTPPTIMTSSVPEASVFFTPKEDEEKEYRSSVKDRISFFNKLIKTEEVPANSQIPSPKPKNTFLSLLRKEEPRETKAFTRMSNLVRQVSIVKNAFKINHHRESLTKVTSTDFNTGSRSCSHVFKFTAHTLPAPLKRKPSFEKTKPQALSLGKTLNNYGTNPRRHHLMQDLSLVVPVKFRVAEFEKQMSLEQ
ncbi:protein bottleneck [Episyrphus balteatus]|uniref:protein bottleneck n=1 Tax=Episyrphus balteatus TaxID=286459 RepID=UPI002486CA46|nr:protein bottleneck [Episyrphus balteatus]